MSLFKTLLFSSVTLAAASMVERQATNCSEVHLFLARGNGEAYPGRVGAIANTACDGLPSCDSENIEWDSSLAYATQCSDGVASGTSQIAAYASSCPDAKLVLAGYSLGAQVVGDILGGGGGNYYGTVETTTSGMSDLTTPGSHIAAVVMFGNTKHVEGMTYNVGTGSGDNGEYPRDGTSLSTLNEYSCIMQDYCLSTDPICALGDDGLSHTTYMTVYADQAGAFIQQKLGYASNSTVGDTCSPATTASSSSATSSSTASSSGSSSSSASTTSGSASSTSGSASSASGTASSTSGSASAGSFLESASATSGSSSASETSTSSTVTYSAFEFANTATVSTTSTYVPSAPTSTLSYTAKSSAQTAVAWTATSASLATAEASVVTSAASATGTSGSGATTDASASASSSSVEVVTGAASSNTVSFGLSMAALMIIKALVF